MTKSYTKALFLGFALLFSTATVNATDKTNETSTEVSKSFCGVSEGQVVEYMMDYGYQVVRMYQIPGSCNIMVDTQHAYDTIVFTNGECITGHEDVQ